MAAYTQHEGEDTGQTNDGSVPIWVRAAAFAVCHAHPPHPVQAFRERLFVPCRRGISELHIDSLAGHARRIQLLLSAHVLPL